MQIDWANTPGVYYAIAYWLGCSLIIFHSPKRMDMKRSVVGLGIFGVLIITLMSVTHGSSKWLFVPFMLLFFMIMWITIYMECKYDYKTALYFAARGFIVGEFIASIEWQTFYYVLKWFDLEPNMLINIIILVFVDGTIYLIMFLLENRNREVNKNLQITTQELVSAAIMTVAIFAVSNLSYIGGNEFLKEGNFTFLFMIRTLVDMGGVAILYAYHVQLAELNMRVEVERLQNMLDMQYNNYEVLEQSIAAVNQKYHDLKYQISVLKAENNSEKSMEYLEQMEKDIKSYEAQNKTGNKVLDTILTGKSLYCQNNWIELTSVIDGEALSFMNDMDVSTLFGNILDNAIESVSKIEQKEKRLIHLAVAKQKNFLRIRAENCYEQELNFEEGMPTTTKGDTKYHGYGLKSIKNTVKKYGGSMKIQAENGWFELRILIPLKANNQMNQFDNYGK